jgi:threonine dehydrogenase-like Zn-dependent dehydrogenase
MFPMGAVMNRGLTIKAAQCPVQHYWGDLLKIVEDGRIDPSFVITHELPLQQAPQGYEMFKNKLDDCVKVVLKPN